MAASAAYLTGTLNAGEEDGHPSVFELISHQSFSHALRPAFLHIVKTLANRFPEGRLPFFYRCFDEIYLAFDGLVQWHYILTRGATLSEAFYGLERKVIPGENKLARIRISYLLSVIFPYLQNKLDKACRENSESNSNFQTQDGSVRSEQNDKMTQLLKYYPFFKAMLSSLNLVYLLSYTFGFTNSHSFIFRFLGMRLSYASPDRAKSVEEQTAEIFQYSAWRNLKNFPVLAVRAMGESVLFAVEIGSFFVQFLDWWYNDPQRQRVILDSLPIPPPPTSRDQNCMVLSPMKCPMCRGKFRNPTALSTSGIVFCYGCITPHLKKEGRCPLTSLRSTMDHLIRLYP